LENVRERLLSLVRAQPGLCMSNAADHLGVNLGTAKYHADRLVRDGLLAVEPTGRQRRLRPAHVPSDHATRLALLRGDPARALASEVLREPGVPVRELCDRLGFTPRIVYYQSEHLVRAGLLREETVGREKRFHPASCLRALLEEVQPPATAPVEDAC
jgi:predicted transcriptional regulator